MPRQPRLDAPDTFHHVMVRGIERTTLFRDDRDRDDFVARLATLAEQRAGTVSAWALLPNHAHLLVRTGARPLARTMRSLLTGYAGAFNRRHHRVGHLFQNRAALDRGLRVARGHRMRGRACADRDARPPKPTPGSTDTRRVYHEH